MTQADLLMILFFPALGAIFVYHLLECYDDYRRGDK